MVSSLLLCFERKYDGLLEIMTCLPRPGNQSAHIEVDTISEKVPNLMNLVRLWLGESDAL